MLHESSYNGSFICQVKLKHVDTRLREDLGLLIGPNCSNDSTSLELWNVAGHEVGNDGATADIY